jgi:hypothetical protein
MQASNSTETPISVFILLLLLLVISSFVAISIINGIYSVNLCSSTKENYEGKSR